MDILYSDALELDIDLPEDIAKIIRKYNHEFIEYKELIDMFREEMKEDEE